MRERGKPEPSILLELFVTFQLSAQAVEGAFAENDLDVPDFALLSTIGIEGPTTASALARRLGMAQRTAFFRVRRLALDGLVERVRSPNDRRAMELRLTSQGNTLLHDSGPVFRDLVARLESRLRLQPRMVREALRDLGDALDVEVAALHARTEEDVIAGPPRQTDVKPETPSSGPQ